MLKSIGNIGNILINEKCRNSTLHHQAASVRDSSRAPPFLPCYRGSDFCTDIQKILLQNGDAFIPL